MSSPLASLLKSPSPHYTKKPRKLQFSEVNTSEIEQQVKGLSSVSPSAYEHLPYSYCVVIIVAKYGINMLFSLAFALKTVPAKFPERMKYVTNIVNTLCNSSFDQNILSTIQKILEDFLMLCCVENSFDNEILWKCSKKYQEPYNAFLTPPVSYCIQSNCHSEIYFHYQSKVILHTFQGPIPGWKATFRCRDCKCIYNIDSFSTPREGKRFYSFSVDWIAASNRVYFSRELHEFLCESM